MSKNNAVEALLMRLDIPEAIPAFREKGIDRLVVLRKLSAEELAEAVPDPAKRQILLDGMNSRGNLQQRRPPPPAGQPHPPRSDNDFMRGGAFDEGRGGGFRGGRGGGRGGRGRGGSRGGGSGGDACRHHFSPEGCKFGDACRYSHDESMRQRAQEMTETNAQRNEHLAAQHEFCVECVVPSERIKYLLGVSGTKLKSINDACGTYNERFEHVDESQETFTLKLYGNSKEAVHTARDMVLTAVGVRKEEKQKNRFQYAVNELDANTNAAKLLCACNTKNADTPSHLSESILRNIISSFRFVKPQQVRHFYIKTGTNDKDKLDALSKIVTQLKGLQAVLFCDTKRVEEMSKAAQRIARHLNNVDPLFMYRSMSKEERMTALEKFKVGEENDQGVKQRLLVTNEDYAKLARKTVIPYVNLVINFSVPRTEEFYVLQSMVAGRHGTIGASFLCVSEHDEAHFRELENNIHFDQYTDEESFRSTAVEMSYDTKAKSLTPADAEPPANWRETLNEAKPKATFGKRR